MAIIPTVRCRRMEISIAFSTNVLDFDSVEHGGEGDPSFNVLTRGGSLLLLSSHAGDGTFGQAIVVLTDSVDALFHKFRMRGLKTPGNPDAPAESTRDPSIRAGGHANCMSTIQMATPYGLWRVSASARARNATPNKRLDLTGRGLTRDVVARAR